MYPVKKYCLCLLLGLFTLSLFCKAQPKTFSEKFRAIPGDKKEHCAIGFMLGELLPPLIYNTTKRGRVGACLISFGIGTGVILLKEAWDKINGGVASGADILAGESGLISGLIVIRINFP